MTREEAIQICINVKNTYLSNYGISDKTAEAMIVAIEALAKMEAIQETIDMPFEWEQDDRKRYLKIVNVMSLKSKQLEERKAKWISSGIETVCSNCYYKLETTGLLSHCPNCGAEMEEEK